jgi:hypothetical protein
MPLTPACPDRSLQDAEAAKALTERLEEIKAAKAAAAAGGSEGGARGVADAALPPGLKVRDRPASRWRGACSVDTEGPATAPASRLWPISAHPVLPACRAPSNGQPSRPPALLCLVTPGGRRAGADRARHQRRRDQGGARGRRQRVGVRLERRQARVGPHRGGRRGARGRWVAGGRRCDAPTLQQLCG